MGTFKTGRNNKADVKQTRVKPNPGPGISYNTASPIVTPNGGHMSKGKKSSSYFGGGQKVSRAV